MAVNVPQKKQGEFEGLAAPVGRMVGTAVGSYFGGPAGGVAGGELGEMAGTEAAGKKKNMNEVGGSTAMQRRQEKIRQQNEANAGENYAGYDATEKS